MIKVVIFSVARIMVSNIFYWSKIDVARLLKDIRRLLEWFSTHDPFPEVNKIVSIASGVVGDDKINCYKAREVQLLWQNLQD